MCFPKSVLKKSAKIVIPSEAKDLDSFIPASRTDASPAERDQHDK